MTVELSAVSSIKDIAAAEWDACAAHTPYNPFVSHAFLAALEESGSAVAKTGWAGRHLVARAGGKVVGVVPCYLKGHSQGEYVFDHGWAEAFHRAGGRYYPKLQVAVPFTPVTGPRLIAGDPAVRALLAEGLKSLCAQTKASSVHVTFSDAAEMPGWLTRNDIQFHWHNKGYGGFDDFLGDLSSAKRKNIRKERQAVRELGIAFELVTGSDLHERHWDAFFRFYMDTGSRKWGSPYLTRTFFSLIGERMAEDVLLVLATRAGKPIAGALNFIGAEALYGRNWGAVENHPFLHFETCYYQAIDFAIARNLARVEAGAQGPHKLARGYLPVKTTSFHHLAHQGLARAVADYLDEERASVGEHQAMLAEHSPFRHEQDF